MINFHKHILDNGLKLLIHEDQSTPLVAVNLLYNVGSRDEDPERTGFAHLFEHLMFNGSKHVPDFDKPLQMAGGENNAFTNSDVTNYYNIAPADNLETILWLESDRMKHLSFDENAFEIQKKVVVEEFKETCLNIPYGDAWHKLANLAYKSHPYRWPTIGKVPEHVSESSIEEVKAFFKKHYLPNNAILVLAGQITKEKAIAVVEKWFGDIPRGEQHIGTKIIEEEQLEKTQLIVKEKVPAEAIYLAFHIEARNHPDYYVCDILSDILSSGRSSRFYQKIYKQKNIFSRIEAYITGTADPGLFIVEGKLQSKKSVEEGLAAIWQELELIKEQAVTVTELQKVKNKIESSLCFSEINVLNKAISLAFFEWLGDAELINHQIDHYDAVTIDDVKRVANKIFTNRNCNELQYVFAQD